MHSKKYFKKNLFEPTKIIFLLDDGSQERISANSNVPSRQSFETEEDLFAELEKMTRNLSSDEAIAGGIEIKSKKETDPSNLELKESEKKALAYAEEHQANFYKLALNSEKQNSLNKIVAKYVKNRGRYEKVAQATGVPTELIAAIHHEESNGNFNTYLHNGQKLGNVTTLVPEGILFHDWESAAIHALGGDKNSKDPSNNGIPPNNKFTRLRQILDLSSPGGQMAFAEMYNGPGYRQETEKRGQLFRSPYVYGGSNFQTDGKYTADRKFDPKAKSVRIGTGILIKAFKSAQSE